MSHRFLTGAMTALIGLALLAPEQAAGQTPSSSAKKGAAGRPWKPLRTPDGQPDFQGVWDMATLTTLERPAEFAGKEFLTEREAAEFERRTLEQLDTDRRDGGNEADLRRNYNQFWRERGNSVVASRRTSLIVDPPDGKIPAFTPEWRNKRAARAQAARLL